MSDIVDDGMSLNAKISDILTDLIAELRDMHADGDVCSSLDVTGLDHAVVVADIGGEYLERRVDAEVLDPGEE